MLSSRGVIAAGAVMPRAAQEDPGPKIGRSDAIVRSSGDLMKDRGLASSCQTSATLGPRLELKCLCKQRGAWLLCLDVT
jgi:hypothetical protein